MRIRIFVALRYCRMPIHYCFRTMRVAYLGASHIVALLNKCSEQTVQAQQGEIPKTNQSGTSVRIE